MRLKALLLLLACYFLASCGSKDNEFRDKYRWLSGKWQAVSGENVMIEKWKWNKHRFEGEGFEMIGEDTVFSEKMFLEDIGGKDCYIVVLPEQAPKLFTKQDTMLGNTFVNRHNQFPYSISYFPESEERILISLATRENPNKAKVSYQLQRLK